MQSAEYWFFYESTYWDYAYEHIQTKSLCLEEFSSLKEEEYALLNEEHRQLQDENWTHVEKLRSSDEREKVIENSNHVR